MAAAPENVTTHWELLEVRANLKVLTLMESVVLIPTTVPHEVRLRGPYLQVWLKTGNGYVQMEAYTVSECHHQGANPGGGYFCAYDRRAEKQESPSVKTSL